MVNVVTPGTMAAGMDLKNPIEPCLKGRQQAQKNVLPLLPPSKNEEEKTRPHGSEVEK